MLRLMAQPPHPGERGPDRDLPTQAIGIAAAAGVASTGAPR